MDPFLSRDPRGGPHHVLPELVPLRVRGHPPRQHLPPHLGRLPLRGIQGMYSTGIGTRDLRHENCFHRREYFLTVLLLEKLMRHRYRFFFYLV